MMSKFKKITAFLFLIIIQLSLTPTVQAISAINTGGMEAQDEALVRSSGLGNNGNLASIISVLISVVLGFLGIVFLGLTIMAGFKWMTSEGNEEEIKKAKASIKNSVMGLLIVLAAYAITYSVFKYLPFTSGGGGVIGG